MTEAEARAAIVRQRMDAMISDLMGEFRLPRDAVRRELMRFFWAWRAELARAARKRRARDDGSIALPGCRHVGNPPS